LKKLTLWVLSLCLLPGLAHASKVLVSIKPLQLIVHEIVAGTGKTDLLVASNASPHDYALRPSDVKKINQADLVVWFGPELEPFLTGILADKNNALALGQQSQLTLREFADARAHDGHHHGNHDPHVWLGPDQARQIAAILAEQLSLRDESNRAAYGANYRRFVAELEQTVSDIKQQLAPVKEKGYYVFHDAYGYFEQYFGMNKLGQFTVSPERKPGAKTLIRIRKALQKGEAKCVFSEPQFKPAIVESVTRGSNVNRGEIDPLATDIKLGASSYFLFLKRLSDSYYHCLTK
jgi:zinc transport system substrate-binding protein